MLVRKENPKARRLRNEALKRTDPLKEGDELHGRETCMADALREIQSYIDAAYWLGANPLSHLRKYFPNFAWKYHEVNDAEELGRIVANTDYALLVMPTLDWSTGIVTARELKRRQPRRICYWEHGYAEDRADTHWPVDALKAYGTRFLSPQGCVTSASGNNEVNKAVEVL